MIGYMVEQELANALTTDVPLATLLTMIEVDPADPAFEDPTKFVGPVYEKPEADRLASEKDWTFKLDGDRWRRVVASPLPKRIVEIQPITWLLEHGAIVICAGGGGIPTMFTQDGRPTLVGVEAVIDKDFASELLARGRRRTAVRDGDRRRRRLRGLGNAAAAAPRSGFPRRAGRASVRTRFDGTQGRSGRPVRSEHREPGRDRLAG